MATIGYTYDRYGTMISRGGDPTAAQVAQVTTDIAAAQLIGASDASAEVDTLDTSYQAVVAAITTVPTAGVKIIIDTGISKNQAIAVLEAALGRVRRSTTLT